VSRPRRGAAQAPEAQRVDGRAAESVPLLERGLHYGDGLFETIACVAGRARFLDRHLQRLATGCARLAMPPVDVGGLTREVEQLAAAAARSVIKLLVTRGSAVSRGYALSGREQPRRIALRYRWPADDPALERDGVRVRIARLRLGENPALAGLKHCNRLEQVLARAEWTDTAITESLLFSSSGALISGTMTNVFLVHDSRLLTPRVDRCGVAGVMRAVVLDLAAAGGIAAEERRLDARHLAQAHEVFLTSALTGIRPVRELDGRVLAPGPVTRALQALLAPLLAGKAQPGRGSR
jgi:4-amino-4-deoxychorismate lyase